MAFFPHLVAGPIMRAKELIGQFRGSDALAPKEVGRGIWLLATGLFMKVVIADQLAPKIDVWFEAPAAALRSRDVAVLALGFGLQMYFDFAGYSRIAQGSGTLCGIRLVKNFNYPFSAVSPPDFWNRWHISLSRWIRDYIFLALVGRSRALGRLCAAAIIAMVLCGLWHGFGVKFVVWGAFHGAVIAGYQIYRYFGGGRIGSALAGRSPTARRAHDLAGWAATTAILLPGWILFRSKTLSQAGVMLATLVTPHRHPGRNVEGNLYLHIGALFALTLLAPFVQSLVEQTFASIERTNMTGLRLALDASRGVAVGVLLAASLLYLGTKASFIYFQF
jgi:D-alanyl-lipoteichoic acid acyltransferase DltB (MBOAT superfamily)